MDSITPWFERKFDFSFPVELHPNLCARLRGTPARLEELVRGHSHEALINKPEEKWSAQEHVGHLLDLEPLWYARLQDYLARRDDLTPADLSNRKTSEAGHNDRDIAAILADFRHARWQLVVVVESMAGGMFAHTATHPRLKTPMRLIDHLFFVAEHDDHHLAHIWKLLRGAK